ERGQCGDGLAPNHGVDSNSVSSFQFPVSALGFSSANWTLVTGYWRLELTNLDLRPGFFLGEPAGEIVGQGTALHAKDHSCQLEDLSGRQRYVTPARGHRQPLVRFELEVLGEVEHGIRELKLDLVAVLLPRVHDTLQSFPVGLGDHRNRITLHL